MKISDLTPRQARLLVHGISGGDGPVETKPAPSPIVARLLEERVPLQDEIDQIIDKAESEERSAFGEDEGKRLEELFEQTKAIDARIDQLEDAEQREQRAAEISGRPNIKVESEPRTYERWKRRTSFFLDVARRVHLGDPQAAERLRRHAQEVQVDIADMETERRRKLDRWLASPDGDGAELRETRDLSGADTAGGEFIPPLWLLEEYAELARAGRPVANAVRNLPLPPGTDSINIPRITTGTSATWQTANNAAVAEQDLVTASVEAPVRTIAGQQDVPLQLLEQSPVSFDEVVFEDLIADLNANIDAGVLNGSGAAGQIRGMLQTSGITTVTYTDATPTVPELYPKIADAIQQGGTARKRPPNIAVAHLRRWMWIAAALDTSNRPLVVPVANGPQNAVSVAQAMETEGIVGNILGPNLLVDLNMPTNLGAGTNEDRIVTTRAEDHLLFEGVLRTRVLPEVLSGTLQVRLQVYKYVAFTAGRFPSGIAVIAGTGLITPTF